MTIASFLLVLFFYTILKKDKGKISHVWPPYSWLNSWFVIFDQKIKLCVCHFFGWMVDLVVIGKNLNSCVFPLTYISILHALIYSMCAFPGWLWILEKDKGKISHVLPPYCWLNGWLVIADQKIKLCVRHFFGSMVDFDVIGKISTSVCAFTCWLVDFAFCLGRPSLNCLIHLL